MLSAAVSHRVQEAAIPRPIAAEPPVLLTRAARLYAVKELARRAGVSSDFFRLWGIECSGSATVVRVLPGSRKQIVFRNSQLESRAQLGHLVYSFARAAWLAQPPAGAPPDLIVPFAAPVTASAAARTPPLFRRSDPDCVECDFDLALATVLMLSRWEEEAITERDLHDRIPATAYSAVRNGYHKRPIVDEWGRALEQALEALLPNWRPLSRELRINISHDIDRIGLPVRVATVAGHALRRGKPGDAVRDAFAWLPGVRPLFLRNVTQVAKLCLDHGFVSAAYWKATRSATSPYDVAYDPIHPKVKQTSAWLADRGVEQGVHPGYDTFRSPDKLRREVRAIRQLLGATPSGGRQHYLRWCPDTWLDWENCGLTYDSSVGFAEQVGFRAGTCFPYRPWLFTLNREARLTEVPLIIMDATLNGYLHLAPEQSLAAIRECLEPCRAVGGVFALLWHSDSLAHPVLGPLFPKVLEALPAAKRFDARSPSKEFY